MRLRTFQRLAMTEAALSLHDLVAACHRDVEGMKLVEVRMQDIEEREKALAVIRAKIAERAKNLAPAKKLNVGRNEPCPCGSGVKFKRCCIRK